MTHLGTITATVALDIRPRWFKVTRVLAWMLGRSIERTVKDVRVESE